MPRFTDPDPIHQDNPPSPSGPSSPRPSPRSHWLAVVAIVALFIVALYLLAHAN